WQRMLRDALLVPFSVLLFAEAAIVLLAPGRLAALGRLPGAAPTVRLVGAALAFSALTLLLLAQVQLGASWRIGIDDGARPGLVTGGMYRFCRNPIYVW